MTDPVNLQDEMLEYGSQLLTLDPDMRVLCPTCGHQNRHAVEMIKVDGGYICSTCFLRGLPLPLAEQVTPWESELANYIRVQRDRLLDGWRWAIMPDSPLKPEMQSTILAYMQILHRITIQFATPEDVTWPDPPVLTSDSYL